MDRARLCILQENRQILLDNLDATYILDKLYSKFVLNQAEYELLLGKTTQRDKTDCLLDLILKKDNRAFNVFVFALKDDYYWLYERLSNCLHGDVKDEVDEQVFMDTIVQGDLPKLPLHYVDRTEKLQELRGNLKNLRLNEKIVVHGMVGSGKSCLAAAAIEDKDLLKHFGNKVFWINLENNTVDDKGLQMHLIRLYLKVSDGNNYIPTITSDLSQSNIILKEQLSKLFRNDPALKKALLILDNVQSEKSIRAFDIGCRLLITTAHASIIDSDLKMKVAESFSERESLKLFANCLKVPIDSLPEEASTIYNLCKGYPLLISLVGSVLEASKEDAKHSKHLWKHIIDKLTKRHYDKLDRKEKIFAAIGLCIERLKPEYRDYYKDLVVFAEDVNIMPKVLQIFWNKDTLHDIRLIMIEFEKMSLVCSYYSKDLGSYIYGIHHIHVAFLKSLQNDSDSVKLHTRLIRAYEQKIGNDFSKLPHDNYILQYLGYHLREARMYDKFKVYFDLNFLGAKIKAAGFADVLADFKTYQRYITNNDQELQNKLFDYKNFIEENGPDLCKFPYTDIVQYGLQQSRDGCIYKAAKTIVENNPDLLYFNLLSQQHKRNFEHNLKVDHAITAACCTDDTNHVLVGNENGLISMWERTYAQKLCTFISHNAKIKHLQLSPEKNEFLSVSDDGTVKLWNLSRSCHRRSMHEGFDDEYSYSPRLKQENHHNFFGNAEEIKKCVTIKMQETDDSIISAAFSNNYIESKLIVTGSMRGKIMTWNMETNESIHNITPRGFPANCVAFSFDDSVIVYTCDKNVLLSVVGTTQTEYLSQINNCETAKQLIVVPHQSNKLIVLNEQCIYIVSWEKTEIKPLRISVPEKIQLVRVDKFSFTCGAVTEDGKFVVAGSTDYKIRIWDICSMRIIEELQNNNGLSVCLDTFYENNLNYVHMLLIGSDDKTIQQWYLQPELEETPQIKNLPVCATYWKNKATFPLIAVANTDKKIQLLNGFKFFTESNEIKSPVKEICFSLTGNTIAYGSEDGLVHEFNYKTKLYSLVMSLHGPVIFLKYFDCDNDENRNCYNGFDGYPGLLVAASENGCLMMYKNGKSFCLRGATTNSAIKQVPIKECFYLKSSNSLLMISKNCTVSAWNLCDNPESNVLAGNGVGNSIVTAAALSNDELYLALGLSNKAVEILKFASDYLSCSLEQTKDLQSVPTCCVFSFDSRLLAIGQDNGDITIWSTEHNKILTTLNLHQTRVQNLMFSPEPDLILVSVGDQCAWWDLSKIPVTTSRRSSLVLSKKKPTNLVLSKGLHALNLGFWNNKRKHTDKLYLLASVKLYGNHNKSIMCSHNFMSFVTINNDGKLDILQAL